jgi:hypothetical protein
MDEIGSESCPIASFVIRGVEFSVLLSRKMKIPQTEVHGRQNLERDSCEFHIPQRGEESRNQNNAALNPYIHCRFQNSLISKVAFNLPS